MLNMEVSRELLNNIGLCTIEDIVGQEGVCGKKTKEKKTKKQIKLANVDARKLRNLFAIVAITSIVDRVKV